MLGIIGLSLSRLVVDQSRPPVPSTVVKESPVVEEIAKMSIDGNMADTKMSQINMENDCQMVDLEDDTNDIGLLLEEMLMKVEKNEMDIRKETEDKKVIEMVLTEIVAKVANSVDVLEEGEIVDMMDVDEDEEAKKKAEFQKYFDAAKQDLRSTLKHRRKGIKRKHQQHQEAAKQAKKARSASYQP